MCWFCAALSAAGGLESAICSCLLAELAGFWLHRLLHNDKLPFFSRSHMVHHPLLYGPMTPIRAEHFKDAPTGRFLLGNVGLEWLAPPLFPFRLDLRHPGHPPSPAQPERLGNCLATL